MELFKEITMIFLLILLVICAIYLGRIDNAIQNTNTLVYINGEVLSNEKS